ncbi:MAG: ABC transporter ATP-binding protein [Candidatus Peribacter sp.]|jgi:ATP-binding cassette, subfamily B, bacterial MsbA|nr:ABC transporter ATP-binding protein [Candidatus Peribacter sp.]MBT4393157.1 ABC transporter ATP-binding protein [Candidatus Peribacter sp.]MBT4600499.1 ABC transporter ATP-binding protein [Candidatus Peribacter sp.]MBT5148525.1 ABC transporter ATP-binding protein [Candidatus Peribacter sp.]MBT5638692.1 ABC transporter ATP-binding protein [Candidatus Peribacter sp.]
MEEIPQTSIGQLKFLLRKIHFKPWYIAVPITFGLFAAAFEGVGMGLLIPILTGFLDQNFTFLLETPVLGSIVKKLPESILTNDRLLFLILFSAFMTAYILRSSLRFLSVFSMAHFSERLVHHLRKSLFVRYLTFGKLFFDTTNVGHHSAVFMEFARKSLQPLISLDKFLNALFALVAYLVVMVTISWRLTLIALPLFLMLHLVVKFLVVRLRKLSHATSLRGSELNRKSIEILSTIPLVKANRTEREEMERFKEISDQKAQLDFRGSVFLYVVQPIQEIVTLIVASAIFFGAIYVLGRDQIASAPAIIVYFYTVINATSKFGTVSGYRGIIAHAAGQLEAVVEVFNDEGKFFVKDGTEELKEITTGIECKDLTFSYTDRSVLEHVSFEIEKGKMTAIVGPSGAGKSTIINLLMRFYDCPPGTLFIDGKDIRSYTLDSYLEHVGIVSQETLLLHDTLRHNILYGLSDVSEDQLQDALKRSQLSGFIEKLPDGLNTIIGDRGVKLSGGEKQRISIARALLKGPEILILDEATSSLDSQTEKQIQAAIDEAVSGRTAIVIAHRLSTIKHADKIITMKDGQLAEEGTLDELLEKKGVFYGLWQEQKF